MAKLIRDDPRSAPEDLVLEVDRVEDARTIRQRLRLPAAQWREFLRESVFDAAPDDVERAYRARQEFWDWLWPASRRTPRRGRSRTSPTGRRSHRAPLGSACATATGRSGPDGARRHIHGALGRRIAREREPGPAPG